MVSYGFLWFPMVLNMDFLHRSQGLERELQLLGVPGQFETLHGGASQPGPPGPPKEKPPNACSCLSMDILILSD